MPICYNVAAITSPVVAGLLANYASNSELPFFRRFPYALPAIASASVALIAFLLVFFKLEEVCSLSLSLSLLFLFMFYFIFHSLCTVLLIVVTLLSDT
jgi:hypothetical protein